MQKIDISKKALDSLFEIEYYLRLRESEKRADKIMESIENQIDIIPLNPFQFPIYKNKKAIRKAIVHRTYIIVFEIFDSYIKILDIYHGKRNV